MHADRDPLHILYRGPLESCNYGCDYCPFAKRIDPKTVLDADRDSLNRFVSWVEANTSRPLGILFTPWGEALVRSWYRDALVRLSHLPHVTRVVIQTNLSMGLDFCRQADAQTLAFRAAYHPEWSDRARFVAKVEHLHQSGIRVSCGVVGMRRFRDIIAALRAELPREVHLWINAVKTPRPEPYTEDDIAFFAGIDPFFENDRPRHPSRGRPCKTGSSAIVVDGDGTIQRCHFVRAVLGNLYTDDLDTILAERPCPRAACDCAIGYVYLEELDLARHFEDGILERIPSRSTS